MSEGNEFIPTRQTLLSRLKDWRDEDSWKEFFDLYWKLIYSTAIKAGLTDAEAQDAVQETVISACKKMPEFVYDPSIGSFKDWLLKLTRWRIVDQFRRRQKGIVSERQEAENDRRTSTVDRLADPAGQILEQVWDREWSANLMDAAIERVKRRVDSKQYQIFDLSVLKEWPVSRISHFLKINPGRVYLAKHRVSKLIEQELRALKSNPTGRPGSSGAGESAGGSGPSK